MDFSDKTEHYHRSVYRVVESQEKVATMALVSNLEEQSMLEDIIEASKPIVNNNRRHYLIEAPFRYPPLKHGSRFGTRHAPSLFYAGESLAAAFCESAYYSFYFMQRSEPYENPITNYKTSFSVELDTASFVDLVKIDDPSFQGKVTDKCDYAYSQLVGHEMRHQNIDAFRYQSARCELMKNVGVFNIEAIIGEPSSVSQWTTIQTPSQLFILNNFNPAETFEYHLTQYLVHGILPNPTA